MKSYWERLRERDATAVRKAFFRATTAHPDWMPSLGQLVALVDLSEREAEPPHRKHLEDGRRYGQPSEESKARVREIVQEVMRKLDAPSERKRPLVPPWKGGPPFEVH